MNAENTKLSVAILFLFLVGLSPSVFAAPSHEPFIFKYESLGADAASSVVVDELGNCYVLGAWTGTTDFDPEHGPVTELTSTGTGPDLFISSYARDGRFRWVKSISAVDATLVRPASLCFAGDGHDLYVSGSFFGKLRLPTACGSIWISRSVNNGARTVSAQLVGGSRDDVVSAIAASSDPEEDDNRRGTMVTAVGQFTGVLWAPRFPSPLVTPPAPADVFVFRQHLWPLPELGVEMLSDNRGVSLTFDPVSNHSYLLMGSPVLSFWYLVESYGVPDTSGPIIEEVVFDDPPPERMFYRLEEVE